VKRRGDEFRPANKVRLAVAQNIRDEGLRMLQTSGTGDKACRPDVRRSSGGRKKSTITLSAGQEAPTSAVGGSE
jgi:putative transposase